MGKQLNLTLPNQLYERIQQWAQARNLSVNQAIIELLDRALPPINSADTNNPLAQEEAAFIAMHNDLRKSHFGEYVAIHNQQLVDHDTNLEQLTLRVRQNFGNQPIWIAPVKDSPQEEWAIRSPRFDGDSH